jgi:molecular chaperone DnaJ
MPLGSSPGLDWYDILGVDPSASDAEIGRAFRSLARRFHPDSGSEHSSRQFSDIAQAYEVLRDPSRRAAYDRTRAPGPTGGVRIPVRRWAAPPRQTPSVDTSETSEEASALDDNTEVEVAISFWESVSGTVTKVDLPRAAICGECSGTGRRSPGPCPTCGGEGRHQRQPGAIRITHICTDCAGTGARPRQRCSACEGRGWREAPSQLTVRVPAGVTEGTKLRLRSSNGQAVALARVAIRPDLWFSRDGRDIVLRLPLNLAEAALGTTIRAALSDGPIQVEVPPSTRHGDRLRVPGRGLPGSPPGDLVAVAEIVMPQRPSLEERGALETLLSVSANPRRGWPAAEEPNHAPDP